MEILLKNGNKFEIDEGVSCIKAAHEISDSLARNAVAAKVNGELCDLSQAL